VKARKKKEGNVLATEPTLENLTFDITQEMHVRAPLDVTFESILEQMGPENETPDGNPLPMVIEARPGGRWFRDLGHDNGHFWGHVQAIKRPTLLEITGPLFMSYPIVSNLQYRLKEVDGGCVITFRHSALGFVPDDYRQNVGHGWAVLLERIKKRAETNRHAH
jgi:hypothetical protein